MVVHVHAHCIHVHVHNAHDILFVNFAIHMGIIQVHVQALLLYDVNVMMT